MSDAARAEPLYDAIERLPEGVVGEIIDHQLYARPRPPGPHLAATALLIADLAGPFYRGRGGPGGWRILVEPELHFRRDAEVLVPDIVGWRREHLPEPPRDHRFEVVPDWICEVLSPATASRDREIKMPVYARYGVAYLWLVDPTAKRVEAYARDGRDWQRIGTVEGESDIRVAPFTEVAVPPPWT
jgi:Uma2 family endonuclease